MGATYTRQSSYTDGDTITADHTNNEFDQLLAAFAASSGHTHDGTTAEGGPITKLLGTTITIGDGTSGQNIVVTYDGESNDGVMSWMEDEDYFEFSDDILVASTEKLQFRDTAIYINSSADGQLDLVADTEIQIAATTIDMNGAADISGNLAVGGNLTVAGNATVTGTTTFNGGTLTLGDSASDNVVFGADVDSHIIPDDDDTYDLGSNSQEWRNIFIDGTAHIDTLDVDVNATVAGTLGVTGAITGSSTIVGTTISASTAFVPTVADGATLGTSSLEFGDLYLGDSGVIYLGADQDVSLTHIPDTGVRVNSTNKIEFNDASQFIHGSSATVLSLGATDEIDLTATAIDINGTVDMSSTLATGGLYTAGAGITSTAVANTLGATSFNDANITNVGNIALDSITADGSTITITGNTTFADGAYDFDIASHDTSNGLKLGGTLVTATAAELNALDGITSTVSELNIVDGDTSASSVTVADADRVVFNDAGTMKQVAVTDLAAYFDDEITAMPNLVTTAATTVGALNSGSITSGFGTIDTGSSTITTTGVITGGTLEATTDTAAGDNAAIGYTAAEGLILTGQGSTSDVVIKNDADGTVFSIATGTTTGAFAGNVTIAGDLTVTGTTTQVDTVTMEAANAVVFEGATADDHETTLTVVDPTADRTINLPNVSGTLPVLAAVSTTQVTSTPEELNILDGATVVVGEINALDLGSTAVGTAIASKAVILDSNKDYTGLRNFTITGELDAATGDFSGAVDIDGDLNVGDDLSLDSDAAVLGFGADTDVTLTHVADTGILLNSSRQIQFGDSGTYIHQSADGVLDLVSDTELELNATTIDINGNVEISGTTAQVGVSTSTAKDIFNAGMSVKNGATSAGFVEFFEDSDNGSNKVTLIGPASTADVTLTLPNAAGTLSTTDDATALAIALG